MRSSSRWCPAMSDELLDPISTHSYLCIGCPLGCRLEVDTVDDDGADEIVEVRGFSCRKGKDFARQEHIDPRRDVSTTVSIDGGTWPRLPVKTSGSVPKHLVRAVCRELWQVTVEAPAELGQVIVADILGTGVDVVATRSMPRV